MDISHIRRYGNHASPIMVSHPTDTLFIFGLPSNYDVTSGEMFTSFSVNLPCENPSLVSKKEGTPLSRRLHLELQHFKTRIPVFVQ